LLDRPTFAARPVADPLKKVTPLLLFEAENSPAVNDKLTKKALFSVGARFSRRSAKVWLSSLLVYGFGSLPSNIIYCRKNTEDYDEPNY
jgi:hypothetical protein